MRGILTVLVSAAAIFAMGQGHDLKPAEALKSLSFMKGHWVGKQDFNTGGAPMVGDAVNNIDEAIGGRYLAEMLSTTLPGRQPTDTRHFITFDPKANLYRAWWFTDTSVGPMEFEGTATGNKLELTSKPKEAGGTVLKATYESPSENKLIYTLEMKSGDAWRQLFRTTYTKKS